MIKVLLVDDHELVRAAIASLLDKEDDIKVVGICSCGEQALSIIHDQPPDVVMLDIHMPGIGGTETCRRILRAVPDARIIGLSGHEDSSLPQQLLKIGAMGFISKGSTVDEMVQAIRAVIAGERYLCSEIANKIAWQSLLGQESSPFTKLSSREAEVVNLILKGNSIQQIAEILMISDKTVNTYRYRLYQKLNIKNDVELTRLAMKFNYT